MDGQRIYVICEGNVHHKSCIIMMTFKPKLKDTTIGSIKTKQGYQRTILRH